MSQEASSQDSVSSSATTISIASSISTTSSPSLSSINCKKRKAPSTQSATHLYEFLPNQICSKLLKCSICTDIVKNPAIHSLCGHLLCTRCFGQVCPHCNQSTRNSLSRIPPDLIHELGELKVECQNCKQTMPQRSFDNHFDHHCKIKCDKCPMNFDGDRKRAVHMESECGFRIVSCDGAKANSEHKCDWTGPFNQQMDHDRNCLYSSLYFFQRRAKHTQEEIDKIEKALVEQRYKVYFNKAENQITSEEAHKISSFRRIHRHYFYGSHVCLVYKDEQDKYVHEHINYESDLNIQSKTTTNFPKRLYKLNDKDVYYILPPNIRPPLLSFESIHPTGIVQTPITLASFALPASSSSFSASFKSSV